MDILNLALFSVAAIILLGSPGPAIAALLAVGRRSGFAGGLRFYGGLQIGLALAAAISASGLFTLLQALPAATTIMMTIATGYLLYLSYKIATSPVDERGKCTFGDQPATAAGGFVLGVSNPKAYVAFASLMASYLIIPKNSNVDVTVKWLVCVIVMITVDLVWLWLGGILRKAKLNQTAERALNITMGATIFLTAILAYF